MKVLLDSHTFLWATTDDPRLSQRARELLRLGENELLLSAASVYELGWKAANGDLLLPEDSATWIRSRMRVFDVRPLAVTTEHAAAAAMLPPIHRDPWDRLIIAQAIVERLPLLTIDERIRRYDVETIW